MTAQQLLDVMARLLAHDEAVRLGCNYSDHPNWKRLVHQHTAHNAPGAAP